MDDDETFVRHHAQRNQARFAVILAIIDAGEYGLFKDQSRIEEIDAARADDVLALLLIELELHAAQPRLCWRNDYIL